MSDTINSEVHSSLTSADEAQKQQIIENSSANQQTKVATSEEPTITDTTMTTSQADVSQADSSSSLKEESKEQQKITPIGDPGK